MRVALLALSAFAVLAHTPAQTPAEPTAHTTRRSPGPPPHTAQLPVTRVSLYKNGVGFFEHSGHVTGSESVTIDFTSAQLNDVLQTLTVLDLGGGRISGAGYNSTTPLDQQLKALPLPLGADPTSVDVYNSLRGARVEVHAPTGSLTGRILSFEVRTAPATTPGPAGAEAQPAAEKHFLTVTSDAGDIRTFELTPAVTVRLLDPPLRADLTRYLQLLDVNRSQGLRHLTLRDAGTGTRDLRISYLSEVPIWKSTYRILFTDPAPGASAPAKQTATLQGWSVVDNTTGEDWHDVQLSLIAGSPQSFLQPLAQPIYSRRPEIPVAEDAQLTPQTHDSGDIEVQKQEGAPPPAVAGVAGMSGGSAGGTNLNMNNGPLAPGTSTGLGSGNGSGIAPGVGGNVGGGPRRIGSAVNSRQFDSLAALAPATPFEVSAAQSVTENPATAASFDDFFAYTLTDPVTIRKNESALVPILQTKIDSERVTLWNPQQPAPLRALWITNTSALTLDRGSFTVVDNGSFGGEGLLETIHPRERRLLSYAVDQAVRVSVDHQNTTRRVQSISVAHGVLRQRTDEIAEVEYLVHNAAAEPRLVIVEQPVRQGWKLDSTEGRSSDPKPAETTPTVYRFRVQTAPGETVRLHLGERLPLTQSYRLADTSDQQLTVLLRNANASPALLAQLEPVFAARRNLAALDTDITARQQQIQTITDDQKRLRDNLAALKGGPDERALSRRYTAELNTQEDTLSTLRRDLAALQTQRTAAAEELSHQIDAVTADEQKS